MTLSIEDAAVAYVEAVRVHADKRKTSIALYCARGRSCARWAEYLQRSIAEGNPHPYDWNGCNNCEPCNAATEARRVYEAAAHAKGVAYKRLKKACAR
jgi:hypothetical protein